jgi:hypothetical protein
MEVLNVPASSSEPWGISWDGSVIVGRGIDILLLRLHLDSR